VAEEANIFSAGDNRACSNGRSGENKCNSGKRARTGYRSSKKGPICDGGRLRKELLCLWSFWAHGSPLQELGSERKSEGRKKTGIWRRS